MSTSTPTPLPGIHMEPPPPASLAALLDPVADGTGLPDLPLLTEAPMHHQPPPQPQAPLPMLSFNDQLFPSWDFGQDPAGTDFEFAMNTM